MDEETTVTSSYMFRGVEYIVTMVVQGGNSLSVEVEDRLTADQWRATFDSAYIEDLTHKTGNFKQFHIFVSMLESAITQTTESVSLDLLTYADLESLRQRKTGNGPKPSVHSGKTATLNSKRYLIVTYTVEFDRIHYPLPLPYMGKPDPRALQETIRQQRNEIKALRQQGGGSDQKHSNREFDKLQKEYNLLLKEKEELEAEFLHFRREIKTTSTGAAVKELRMLKALTKNLEEDLMKEKSRHQKSTSKRSQEYRDLLEEVEELRASERNLRIRVKSLTNELAVYKRDKVRNPMQRSSRPPIRERYNSRERSISRERLNSRERSLSRESLLRDRSYSSDGGYSARDSSVNRHRRSSRERSMSAREQSRLSSSNRSSNSLRNSLNRPRSRTPSPSPAGARVPRFDPTAYVKDQERKKREQQLKKNRGTKSNLSGTANRFRPSPKSRVNNYSRLSGGSNGSRNRSRTSSFGSQGDMSDGGYSDSSYSRLRTYNKNQRVSRSANSYASSPEMPQKTVPRRKLESKDPISSTPDTVVRTRRRRNLQNKENYAESAGEDSDYYNGSEEISEIDSRLSKLQALMKNSLD